MFHDSFELKKNEVIEERGFEAFHLIHKKTKAEVLYLKNEDKNKTFEIAFKTLPADDTGVAHILEHSVLAGSEKYPVSDPFFEMTKTSLSTFMNAMTGSDKTLYPFSSMNHKDFENLMNVYLDCIFAPLLDENTFKREGWHYELDSIDGELKVNGIVFNEMKGMNSGADKIVWEETIKALFDNVYKYDSGGDPKKIINLTHEEFIKFYKKFYHPSNSYTVLYGDLDIEKSLTLMEEYLSRFEYQDIGIGITPTKLFKSTKKIKSKIPASTENPNKGTFICAYALPERLEPLEDISLGLLSGYLFKSNASPLERALLNSGLGDSLAGWGYSTKRLQPDIATGLENVSVENFGKVSELIQKTLVKIAEKIDKEAMEAIIDKSYFSIKEKNTNQKGIAFATIAYHDWMFGKDPIDVFKFEDLYKEVREKFKTDDRYFENLLKKHLINNPYRVEIEFHPDVDYLTDKEKELNEFILSIDKKLTKDEREVITKDTVEYKEWVQKKTPDENLQKLPRLEIGDIEKKISTIENSELSEYPCKVVHSKYPTNEIMYLDIAFDFSKLSLEMVPYAAIYNLCFTNIGTKKRNYQELATLINKYGNSYLGSFISPVVDSNDYVARLISRSKFLNKNLPNMLEILNELFFEIELDNKKRLKQILLETKKDYENGFLYSAHRLAMGRAISHFTYDSLSAEHFSGLEFYMFIRNLLENYDKDYPQILDKLNEVKQKVINRENCAVFIGYEGEIDSKTKTVLKDFLGSIPTVKLDTPEINFIPNPRKEVFTYPSQVNYVGSAAFLKDFEYLNLNPAFNTLLREFLLDELRFKGGAYGGGSRLSGFDGLLSFYSYRDPNISETLKIFRRAFDELKKTKYSKTKIEGIIIASSSAQDINESPQNINLRVLKTHLNHVTDEILQKKRDSILGSDYESFMQFVKKQELKTGLEDSSVVITGEVTDELKDYTVFRL